ncbi:alpha-tocopherol transfer protein-like, partial [Nephila pilipes]
MALKYEEMMKEKGFLDYAVDCKHPQIKQRAKDELGETDEVRRRTLEQFRKMVLADKKLDCLTDDEFLLMFLRARKYNEKRAIDLLRSFFHTISSHPEIFNKLDKEKIYKLTGSKVISALPFRDNEGCLILIGKIGLWDVDEFSEQVLFSTALILYLCAVNFEATQVTGVRVI